MFEREREKAWNTEQNSGPVQSYANWGEGSLPRLRIGQSLHVAIEFDLG